MLGILTDVYNILMRTINHVKTTGKKQDKAEMVLTGTV